MRPAKFIGMEIGALDNLITRQTIPNMEDIEMTRMHGMLIGFLMDHEGGVLQKEIEEEFSIRRSTVSRVLKLMESKGLITRQHVDYDARLKEILPTEKARQAHQNILHNIHTVETKLTKGLSQEELKQFSRILSIMKQNLSE